MNDLQPGEYIEKFVSGGPKNYMYQVVVAVYGEDTKAVHMVRGITVEYC
jgi:hypothetical protein